MERIDTIVNYIESQLEYREELFNRNDIEKTYGKDGLLQEFGVINCSGLRQSGFTSAIAKLFNPQDVYITHNNGCITEFKNRLKDLGKSTDIYSLSINNVKHSNYNTDKDMFEKLNKYLDKLTVLHIVDGGIENLQKEKLKDDIYKIVDKHNANFDATHPLRGRSFTNNEEVTRVFIDLGVYVHQINSIRIEKLIKEIYMFNTDRPSKIVFILT